jgi:hypothetical protein
MSPGPDPKEDEAYWDRMLRAAYGNREKYVWDSLGVREHYSIDPERPCSQGVVTEDVNLPDWVREPFDKDIESYKEAAKRKANKRTVDKHTEERLADLGYR